jgi:hypothetical protein
MAATGLDRNTQKRGPIRQQPLALAAASTGAAAIPIGTMVMVLTPSTGALRAADTATGRVIGVACQAADFALGDRKIIVEKGIFKMANDGSITAALVGQLCFVVDNQTVGTAAGPTNDVPAGYVDSVESDGVFVAMTGDFVGAA